MMVRHSTKTFRYPIAGCNKVYVNARASESTRHSWNCTRGGPLYTA
jgi:hypothetical protein